MKPARVISALAVASVTLLAVACSDDSATAPTTGPSTSGEATTTSVDDNAPTTSGEAPTTTVEPITAPTDPNETTPDQSTTEPPTFEERAAQEKAQAVVDALPEGWVGAVVDATTASPSTAEFVLYNKCQGTDGYDFLNDFAADKKSREGIQMHLG